MTGQIDRTAGVYRFCLSVCLWCCLVSPVLAASAHQPAPLPTDSVYRLSALMTDQTGRNFKLEALRGRPVLVSMIYNSCTIVCPMLIDTMAQVHMGLSESERTELSTLVVTFDPQRDDVKTLKSVADKRQLQAEQWTLARTDKVSTRKIAALLGIQYRLLPDGEYNHTTVMLLLDAEGRILGRSSKMGVPEPGFLQLVKQTISRPPAS